MEPYCKGSNLPSEKTWNFVFFFFFCQKKDYGFGFLLLLFLWLFFSPGWSWLGGRLSSWPSGWHAGVGILCPRGTGSIPVVTSYLAWDEGQWRDSVSSSRVDPALNGYLEKSGEGKSGRVCESTVWFAPNPPPIALPGWRAMKRISAPPVWTFRV